MSEADAMAAWHDVDNGADHGDRLIWPAERKATWKQRTGWYRPRTPQSRKDRDAYIETLKTQYGTGELLLAWLAVSGTIVTDPRADMDWLRHLCLKLHAEGRIVRDRSYAQTRKSAYQAFKLPEAKAAQS